MKKIDTTYWKPFPIYRLFRTEGNGKQVPTGANVPKLELKENGSTPRITVTGINNGVFGYFDYIGKTPKNYRIYENFISVSFLGTVFYQPSKASLDMKVHCLKLIDRELNPYLGEFLVSAIRASLKNFKYADQISSTVLPQLFIYLPTKDDEPDWQYMEDYMHHIEQRVHSSISALNAAKYARLKIDHSNWKVFELKRLFDVVLSKGDIQAKRMKEGDIPLVSSGKFNNGICKYIAEGDGKAEMFDANVITTDMFGKSYFQDKPFFAVSHGRVNILLPLFKINSYIAKFLVSVLDASFLSRYSFSGMCCQKALLKEKILLPAKGDEPDWHYMEMYMRGVEAIVKNKLSLLIPHKPELTIQDAASITFNGANVTYIDNSRNYSVEK